MPRELAAQGAAAPSGRAIAKHARAARLRERREARMAKHRALAAAVYARASRSRFVRELADFVRIPSISGDRRHAPDIQRCAHWLANHLRAIGLDHVRIARTKGN